MKRIPVPGPSSIVLLAVLGAFALLPIWSASTAPIWTACVLLGVILAALDVLLRPPEQAVKLARRFGEEYRVGRRAQYTLALENASPRRLELKLREVLPAAFEPVEFQSALRLEPWERRELQVEFLPLERGSFFLEPASLRARSALGFLSFQERAGPRDEVVILPGRPAAETAVLLSRAATLAEAGQRLVRRRGHDSDFESLRDYVIGDDLRFVDWKATARRFRPQVRQFQMERNAEVILALDCGRLMGNLVGGVTKLDLAIIPLLDLAAVALQRGERVGLLAFDSEVLSFVPPRSGRRQLGALSESLGKVSTGFRQTSYIRALAHLEAHHRKRSLVVVFTDFTDELSSRELQLVLGALARRHVLLFVAVADRHLEELIAEEPKLAAAVYEKAAACELLVERRRVLQGLNRLGAFTVDADPYRLSAPLVQRYLEARGRM